VIEVEVRSQSHSIHVLFVLPLHVHLDLVWQLSPVIDHLVHGLDAILMSVHLNDLSSLWIFSYVDYHWCVVVEA